MPYGQMDMNTTIRNYDHAKAKYENTKPIRGRSVDIRPLEARRNDKLTIRKVGDGYVIKMYHTDIVTYHADGSISFDPYKSITTSQAVNRYTPYAFGATYTSPAGPLISVSTRDWKFADTGVETQRIYNATGGITFHADGTVTGGEPFTHLEAAPKAQRDKVLASVGFTPFALWLKTVSRLGVGSFTGLRPDHYAPQHIHGAHLVRLLHEANGDAAHYTSIVKEYARPQDLQKGLDNLLSRMRRAIYAHTGCVRQTVLPYATSWTQVRAIETGIRTYG